MSGYTGIGCLEIEDCKKKYLSKTLQIGNLASLSTLILHLPSKGYKLKKKKKQTPTILTHGNLKTLTLVSSIDVNENYNVITE